MFIIAQTSFFFKTSLLFLLTFLPHLYLIVYIPTGEEPEVLLWPMPSEYHSGDKVMTIDPVKLRFHMNIKNEELAEATRRYILNLLLAC